MRARFLLEAISAAVGVVAWTGMCSTAKRLENSQKVTNNEVISSNTRKLVRAIIVMRVSLHTAPQSVGSRDEVVEVVKIPRVIASDPKSSIKIPVQVTLFSSN